MLGAPREEQRLFDVGRRYAYQDDGPHTLRMPAHVDLGGECAIRCPKHVDLAVPQGGAHFVEVVHGDGCGVELEVGNLFELLAALENLVAREQLAEEILHVLRIVFQVALERVRAAGPPLVDEHEITLLAAGSQGPSDSQRERIRSRCARSAVEPKDGIGCGRLTQGFEDNNLEVDRAPGLSGTVFKDLVGSTAGFALYSG